jgi:L-lactate dehydrogenase complex protein LldE
MVRQHYNEYLDGMPGFDRLKQSTYELCEFLVDILGVTAVSGRFPYRVGLHQSCHGLRELRLAQSSEIRAPFVGRTRGLLESLDGITLVEPSRPDECCGFGGTFAVNEEAVSCMMGEDRIHDHQQAGAQILTANDMSCLMHLDGLIRRRDLPLQVMHIAEILAGEQPAAVPSNTRRG